MEQVSRRVFYVLLFIFFSTFRFSAAEQVLPRVPVVGVFPQESVDKFSFAVLGDKTSGNDGIWEAFDKSVDTLNLLAPDFAITVGDQIPGHMEGRQTWDAQWQEYLSHARRLKVPIILVPGNHDIANTACYRFWQEDFGDTYYSFLYGGCLFVVLNTEEERWDGRGPVWEKMMTYAEKALTDNPDVRHTFLFFHKPMWDDPRFQDDWKRLETALGDRDYTAVAGHEHYLMTERRANGLLVIQSATGGGLETSPIKEFGAFHSVGFITVDGPEVSFAVIEPDGGVHPVDIAPASFRKALSYDLVRMDADQPFRVQNDQLELLQSLEIANPLDEDIIVEVTVKPVEKGKWEILGEGVTHESNTAKVTRELVAKETWQHRITFRLPVSEVFYPPLISWRVSIRGEWLTNENYPMSQENVPMLYAKKHFKAVPFWQTVGPFRIGPIRGELLPQEPEKANPRFFERLGPEDGYDTTRTYGDGCEWRLISGNTQGLLNFNASMGTVDEACAFALCGIYSPEAQQTHALMYSDNFHQAFLNGRLIEQGQDFGSPSGFTYVPLDLKEGWNTFVAKLINNKADWFLRVLIADPRDNLTFADKPVENQG